MGWLFLGCLVAEVPFSSPGGDILVVLAKVFHIRGTSMTRQRDEDIQAAVALDRR